MRHDWDMALVTPTTRAEAEASLLANSDYRSQASGTSMARQYRLDLQYLILSLPERAVHGGRGGEEIQTNVKLLQEWLNEVEDWIESQQDSDQGVKFLDFSEYRS